MHPYEALKWVNSSLAKTNIVQTDCKRSAGAMRRRDAISSSANGRMASFIPSPTEHIENN